MNDHAVPLLDRGFALIIAFLLPGLVTLFGIATANPTVHAWFIGAQNGPTIVGFLFVLFGALAINLVITCLRWYLYEHMTLVGCSAPLIPPAPPFSQRNRQNLEVQYIDLRHQFYYHYLAYSNMSVAVPIAVIAWIVGSRQTVMDALFAIAVAALLALVLGSAGCDAVARYDRRTRELLGIEAA